VIEKFKLEERYVVPNRDAAREELWMHCGASIDRRTGIVSLSCEDRDPRVAMEMAAYFGEVGNRVFGRVSASSAREERMFLEAQVAKVRTDVDEASRKLRDFQRAYKIVDLPEQSRAVISAMAALKGELLSKQLELSYQSSFAADSESSVTQLRRQIHILARKLRELEAAKTTAPSDFFPAATSVPDIRFELEQLVRIQKIQETLFFVLTQRYETAKVDEARDTSTFQILDHPTQPANPCRPRRMKTALLGGFLGLVAACVWIVLHARYRRQTSPPNVE
jgi:tyrosine-protein kinase Etk/Wzc